MIIINVYPTLKRRLIYAWNVEMKNELTPDSLTDISTVGQIDIWMQL